MADTILVIEKKEQLRGRYQIELQSEGYSVITAADGHDAIQKLIDRAVDLVVMDLELNGSNGTDYIRDILIGNRKIKVVINTANSAYMMDCNSRLADAFILKSPDLRELKNTIDSLLKGLRTHMKYSNDVLD